MSSSRVFVFILALGFAFAPGRAAPVLPKVLCDRTVLVFGEPMATGTGVRDRGHSNLATRVHTFFDRVCHEGAEVKTVAGEGGRLVDTSSRVLKTLGDHPHSIAFIHFPFGDIAGGASVDRMLSTYRDVLNACAAVGTLCIIGGQQPVNSLGVQATDRQLELERRAAAEFGMRYLPLYRFFQSETTRRRLMVPLDAGDGRHLSDEGHALLFVLYRQRLLTLANLQWMGS